MAKVTFSTIDEYIATFPKDVQQVLQQVRQTIRDAAPDATEAISYQIPTFKLNGNLVHFAGWKKHIGFYPGGAIDHFEKELAGYDVAKGTIQFPLDKPMPLALIRRIVKQRVKENKAKAAAKK
jgi:uncharacterized protein YdhG (YjbR/CyaY superfamily)